MIPHYIFAGRRKKKGYFYFCVLPISSVREGTQSARVSIFVWMWTRTRGVAGRTVNESISRRPGGPA